MAKKLLKLKNNFNENNSYVSPKHYINSFNFIKLLSKSLKGNENIVTDMGTSFTCTMQSFHAKKNQRLFTSSGIAAMGFGLPGLIGTYFADKKKSLFVSLVMEGLCLILKITDNNKLQKYQQRFLF